MIGQIRPRGLVMGVVLSVACLMTFAAHVMVFPRSSVQDYLYREFKADYDTIAVFCHFGEICLPADDSLAVQFKYWHEYETPTSEAGIADSSYTAAFLCDSNTTISLWHMLAVTTLYSNIPVYIPDTISWTLQLRKYSDSSLIATLDSIGFPRQGVSDTTVFPVTFGLLNTAGNSYETVTYDLSNYISTPIQAYLTWKIDVSAGQQDHDWYINDGQRYHTPLSAEFEGDGGAPPPAHAGKDNTTNAGELLEVFPNPITSDSRVKFRLASRRVIEISLFSPSGSRIATLYEGEKAAGTHVLGLRWPNLATGAYFVGIRDASTRSMLVKKFVQL